MKNIKSWIHPASSSPIITPGTQGLTHPLGRQGKRVYK